MIDKRRGYAYHRPFYNIAPGASFVAGQIAFLDRNLAGTATVAASGDVPIGTFWGTHTPATNLHLRSTMENITFSATTNQATVRKRNIYVFCKITDTTGATTYTYGVDYDYNIATGVVTNLLAGIAAGATVTITYFYTVGTTAIYGDLASTRWSTGENYDKIPDDASGSGKIAVAEGDAQIYTDMYDVTQSFTLGQALMCGVIGMWYPALPLANPLGYVIHVPTITDPFLGVQQVTIATVI